MNKKIKLLIIGSSQGVYGGIEAFMLAIADAVAQWPEFEISLCYKLVDGFAWNKELKDMLHNKPYNVFYVEKASKELFSLIKETDVLHIQNMPPDIVIPAFIRRKKIFLTIHNRKMSGNYLRYKVWTFCSQLATERWYNSSFVHQSWEGPRLKKNSEVIPTVCALPQISSDITNRSGFLFVGRWIENKGIEEIIEAYSMLTIAERKKFPLTILGTGRLKDKIDVLIEQVGLKCEIHLPGFVTDEEKANYFSQSKWLLAPANTNEDLGLTPIEARNISLPAIVSRDGGLPEAAGPAAVLVTPGDVHDLYEKMKIVINMSEEEYLQRAKLAKESLKDFLKPMEYYRSKFQ